VSAVEGDVAGEAGARRWSLEGDVTLRDPEDGLELHLPRLAIDEGAGRARSEGDVAFGGQGFRGTASGLTYDLGGAPTVLDRPELVADDGARIRADGGLLHDGLRDVELTGDVRARRGEDRLDATRLRLIRGEDDRLRRALASGGASAGYDVPGTGTLSLAAERIEAWWDDAGAVSRSVLEGRASIARGRDRLAAESIELERVGDESWAVEARRDVALDASFAGGEARLETGELDARVGDDLALRDARARDGVRFESPDTLGEADRGTFVAGTDGETIELFAGGDRKARIARERMRVAAEAIRTDPRGRELVATGQVEATLLGASGSVPSSLFRPDEAIHFVASRLDGTEGGTRLVFTGAVRGWQKERSLAAQAVHLDQAAGTILAEGRVSTRIPRVERAAAREGDYVLVTSDRLTYDEAAATAHYEGGVRVRMAEGLLEAAKVDVFLAERGGAIREVRATDDVTVELRASEDDRPVHGTSDELVYRPEEETVVLMGHAAPATAKQAERTTRGRVLRYRLDDGTLEVEAGASSTARAEAPEPPPAQAGPPGS
jgi:lipopolysaccharide transport protein LptA